MKRILLIDLDKQIEHNKPDSILTQMFNTHLNSLQEDVNSWCADSGVEIELEVIDEPDPDYANNPVASRSVTRVYMLISETDQAWLQLHLKVNNLKPARAMTGLGFVWQ